MSPINWDPNDLPPGSARWARQLQGQVDQARTDLDRLIQGIAITNRANGSTAQSLSQQIQQIEAQQAAIVQAQANIVAAQNYTTSLAQVYANGTTNNDSAWASGGFSSSSGIRISVTAPIVTGRVVVELNGLIAASVITFSCADAGLTQATARTVGPANSIYTTLSNVGTSRMSSTRRVYLGGLPIGNNSVFTIEAYSYDSTNSFAGYPSISVQNVGLD